MGVPNGHTTISTHVRCRYYPEQGEETLCEKTCKFEWIYGVFMVDIF